MRLAVALMLGAALALWSLSPAQAKRHEEGKHTYHGGNHWGGQAKSHKGEQGRNPGGTDQYQKHHKP